MMHEKGRFHKKFNESLREHVIKIINFEKNKMITLTNAEYESYLHQINCQIGKNVLT